MGNTVEKMNFYEDMRQELAALEAAGSLRQLRTIRCVYAAAELNGASFLNFSGNDYLGIAGDSALRREFYRTMRDSGDAAWTLSAASSRLLTGNSPEYDALEAGLSAWYGGKRAALVFNSGYHANVGILPALSRKGDLILSDKLNHASMIDGMRLCEAEFKRYRHLDYDQLEQFLKNADCAKRRVFIASESVFSMDGDAADLRKLVELKERYGAILVIDEAHSAGAFHIDGTGYAAMQGVADRVDVLIGTFGKAFGSAGAYAIVDPVLREYLVNRMRTLIFTTGLPPVVLAWSRFVLEHMNAFQRRRERLQRLAAELRAVIRSKGYETGGDSQIVPLMVGGNVEAGLLAEKLRAGGVLVFPIRPPTVPKGTARLRFSLNAELPDDAIARVGALL